MKHIKFNLIKFISALLFTLQIGIFLVFLAAPLISQAQSREDIMDSLKFTPQIGVPNSDFNKETINDVGKYNEKSGEMNSTLLARYIAAIYNYGLAIAAILATLVLMGGGLLWLISAGDSGKIGQAKELITGSITGIVILVVAWIILNTINPNLVNLQPIVTQVIKKVEYCCDPKLGNVLMDKDGNCPGDNSQRCVGNEVCENKFSVSNDIKTNSFVCLDKNTYGCCQYHYGIQDKTLYCEPVVLDQACPGIPKQNLMSEYHFDKKYSTFCSAGDYEGSDCTNKLAPCIGKDNGSHCTIKHNIGYCYNDICWGGNQGKVGDPCGEEDGAKCFNDNCPDGYSHELEGGRSCGVFLEDIRCCYPDPK